VRHIVVTLLVLVSVAACATGNSDHPSSGPTASAATSPPSSLVATGGPSVAPSSRAVVVEGPFQLVFELPKSTWSAGETITGTATLSVTGSDGVDLGGSGEGLFGFEFADVAGTHDIAPGWTADCRPYRLDPGTPLASPIRKSGGFTAEQSDAAFVRAFLADPLTSLPRGDWRITALADFIEQKDCSGQSHTMRATVLIHVTP
jgi:hypothetical protein